MECKANLDLDLTNQNPSSQAAVQDSTTNHLSLAGVDAMFSDDMMLGFEHSTQFDPGLYGDPVAFQDMQNLPWYTHLSFLIVSR